MLGEVEEGLQRIGVSYAVSPFDHVIAHLEQCAVHDDARPDRLGTAGGHGAQPRSRALAQVEQGACGVATQRQRRVCQAHRTATGVECQWRGGEPIDAFEQRSQHALIEQIPTLLWPDVERQQLCARHHTVVIMEELGEHAIERGGHGATLSVRARRASSTLGEAAADHTPRGRCVHRSLTSGRDPTRFGGEMRYHRTSAPKHRGAAGQPRLLVRG